MQRHLIRADLLYSQRRYAMAIDAYREALADDPLNATVHVRLALALLREDKWNEALRSADVALGQEPDDPEIQFVRALIFLERSMLKEAEAALRSAQENAPDDAEVRGLLARVYYEKKSFEEALAATEAGLALDADNDLCLTYRARALAALGRHAESEPIAEVLLQEDPLDAWNHCLRGEQLLVQGKPHEARGHFLESLRLDPGNTAAREGFALALKARSPLFGAFLSFCLWTDRFKARSLWGALIVMFLGVRFGNAWVGHHPGWGAPWEILKAVVFGGFILMLLANPLFDLILRFDSEGRHALSDDERRATHWYLALIGLAGLCGLWAAWSGKGILPRQLGIAFLVLCAAVYQIFQARSAWVRRRMAWPTVGLAAVLISLPLTGPLLIVFAVTSGSAPAAKAAVYLVLALPVVAVVFGAFADGIRKWLEQRCPD